MLIGVPLGILSAVRRGSLADRAGMIFALFGVSAPVFWLAYILLYIFWFKLQWLPGTGTQADETVIAAVLQGRFILPWITLALTFAAFYLRMVRGNLIETMGEDYIRTARAKGLRGAHGDLPSRPAGRAHARGHDVRPGPRDPAGRRDHHRDRLQHPGDRPVHAPVDPDAATSRR